jgi:hypothetical protein
MKKTLFTVFNAFVDPAIDQPLRERINRDEILAYASEGMGIQLSYDHADLLLQHVGRLSNQRDNGEIISTNDFWHNFEKPLSEIMI